MRPPESCSLPEHIIHFTANCLEANAVSLARGWSREAGYSFSPLLAPGRGVLTLLPAVRRRRDFRPGRSVVSSGVYECRRAWDWFSAPAQFELS